MNPLPALSFNEAVVINKTHYQQGHHQLLLNIAFSILYPLVKFPK